MENEFNISTLIKHLTPGEIVEIRNSMVDRIWEWVMEKYPKIRLEVLERNLPQLLEIKKYDDQCPVCMSVQSCPSQDANRMQGRLDADGVVTIWMEPCPQEYRLPKGDTDGEGRWSKC